MTLRVLVVAMLSVLSFSASAEFHTVRLAYEVALNDFRAPATVNGMLTMRKCSRCEQRSLRVNDNTRYELNHEVVDLAEFRKRLLTVRDRDHERVIVLHHLESDTVTSVSATL